MTVSDSTPEHQPSELDGPSNSSGSGSSSGSGGSSSGRDSSTSSGSKFLPDIGDIIFVLMLYIMLVLRPTLIFSDGSTGWHLFDGINILQDHTVGLKELISYNFLDREWVRYEWLSDTIMAWFYNLGGIKLLAVAVSAAIASLFLLLYERCRRSEGCHFIPALVLVVLGALTSSIHWLARPHLFTFFGVYLFTTTLEDRYRGSISGLRFFLPLPLFMVIWMNSHPAAFPVGLGLIGIYFVSTLINLAIFSNSEKRAADLIKARDLLIVAALTLVATAINPYGIKLYAYTFQYLKGNSVIQATQEYMSPLFHGDFAPACLEIMFALFIVSLAISSKRLSLPRLICCVAFAHMALTAVRHMPLFVIVAVPAIAQLFSTVRPLTMVDATQPADSRYSPAAWWRFVVAKLKEVGDGFNENEALCQAHLIPVLTVFVLGIAAVFWQGNLGVAQITSDFDGDNLPGDKTLKTLAKLEKEGLKPESGFNYDNWGGYLRLKMYDPANKDRSRVFIDDRADFYGENFYQEYAAVIQTAPGYNKVLDAHKINWILVPPNQRLTVDLKSNPDWQLNPAASDKAACLFVRKKPI
jgi:hypothetical protein